MNQIESDKKCSYCSGGKRLKLLLDVTITAGCCVKVNKAPTTRESGSRNWVSQQNLQEGNLREETGIKAAKTGWVFRWTIFKT